MAIFIHHSSGVVRKLSSGKQTWVTWVPLESECSKPSHFPSSCSSNGAAALACLVPWESTECSDMCEMFNLIRRGEGMVWMHGGALQTWGLHSKTFLVFAQSYKTLHSAIIFLSPFPTPLLKKKEKGQAQHWSTFQRMVCFISPQCSTAFGENLLLCF